jgi:hypothetical protein
MPTANKILRVNYSLLRLLEDGRYEEAVAYYHGVSRKPTQAMQAGSYFDKLWEKEMLETGRMPQVFGARELKDPKIQVRLERQLTDWLVLHGKPDLVEPDTITDFKTGVTEATSYAASKQHKVYQILLPDRKYFDYRAYNQYAQLCTMQRIHLTAQTLSEGLEWVVDNAMMLRTILLDNGELGDD